MDRKGLVGVAKAGLVVCFAAAALVMFSTMFVSVTSLTSQFNRTFNASPYSNNLATSVYLNWSGPVNITATFFFNGISINISNSSTSIYGIYWQNTSYSASSYGSSCFKDSLSTGSMSFAVQNNVTLNFASPVMYNLTASTNSTLFNLSYYPSCPPGKYYGNFSVVDANNESEHVNLTASIMIPASSSNILNASGWNYTGTLQGYMPPNATYYHSYYFNLTELANATGLTLNLSGVSRNTGMYLFYGNGTPAAQCENSSSCEIPYIRIMNASFLTPSDLMMELRVYGNFSGSLQPYAVNFYYSTINVTNDTGRQITLLDFGTLTPNSTTSNLNFTLSNVEGKNITDINQTVDLWWTKSWNSRNDDQAFNGTQSNFTIVVPNFTSRIDMSVEWRNTTSFANLTDWDLFLADPVGRIVSNSTGNFMSSNFTSAVSTESISYSGPFNSSNAGFWNITVNATRFQLSNTSIYNVTVKMWFNTSGWTSTNFTQNAKLNMSGEQNSTRYVLANVSVPAIQLLNGTYQGYIQYSNAGTNGAGWKVRIPLSLQVNVGMLVINNSVYGATSALAENTGMFRKMSVNLSVSNAGGSAIIYSVSNSSNLTYGSGYMNLTINSTWLNASGGTMQPRENRSINISIDINTSNTGNVLGVYTGWITFNVAQNSTNNISMSDIFNISINVNLTNNLVVNISQYYTGGISKYNPFINAANAQNITALVNVSLQNGTVISNNVYKMNESNFTSFWLVESNTSYQASLQNITYSAASTDARCFSGGFCMINVSVPSSVPGGRYTLYTTAQWNTTGNTDSLPVVLTGTGGTYPLTIWAPGLKLNTLNSSNSISTGEAVDVSYNLSITNYGPKAATSGIISMNNSCSYVIVNATSAKGNVNSGTCTLSENTANSYFTIGNIDGNGSACWVVFNIHANNVSTVQSCASGTINVSTTAPFFNYVDTITVGISNTDGGVGGTPEDTGSLNNLPSYTYNRSVAVMSYNSAYSARLGENISTTVTVKNTGNTSSVVWLTATTNNSAIITAVSPTFIDLPSAATGTFTVYMNVSGSSRLGLFAGTFKAYVEGYADTWYSRKPFDFTVNSTAERVSEINASFANYTSQFANLTGVFNSIKAGGFADAGNLTRVGQLFNDTSDLVARIEAALNSGNYAIAESLTTELAGRLDRLRAELVALQSSEAAGGQKFFGDLVVWVVIGLVIAGAAGVVIYMLLPTKHAARRINIPGLKKRAEKSAPPDNGKTIKTGGIIKKIKDIFRRKEKGTAAPQQSQTTQEINDANVKYCAELGKGNIQYLTAKYVEGYEQTANKGKKRSLNPFRKRGQKTDTSKEK